MCPLASIPLLTHLHRFREFLRAGDLPCPGTSVFQNCKYLSKRDLNGDHSGLAPLLWPERLHPIQGESPSVWGKIPKRDVTRAERPPILWIESECSFFFRILPSCRFSMWDEVARPSPNSDRTRWGHLWVAGFGEEKEFQQAPGLVGLVASAGDSGTNKYPRSGLLTTRSGDLCACTLTPKAEPPSGGENLTLCGSSAPRARGRLCCSAGWQMGGLHFPFRSRAVSCGYRSIS